MSPNAPVKNFRYPRFAESGYTEWVLQGEKGIYDSEAQIRVEGMALRVYSGDERMTRELTLESPEATIRTAENRAFSKAPIQIAGANFTISGTGWEWLGESKEIVVAADTVVTFTQEIDGGLSGRTASEAVKQTVIRSERLVLQTTEKEYRFEFSGAVRVKSAEMDLASNLLIALADVPEGAEGVAAPDPGKLDSVRQIIAMEEVQIMQSGRQVRAGEVQFFPREGRATLTKSPEIEVAGAYLSGAVVRSQSGVLQIEGSPSEGRAQMILTETGGLGLQGMSALSEETIVLANKIRMESVAAGNRFFFEEDVHVMSGAVQLRAAMMTVEADAEGKAAEAELAASEESEAGELKVGVLRRLMAEGGVSIEQGGQVATGEAVVFYPSEERAVLTGKPRVTNGETVVTGSKMELKPQLAVVSSEGSEKVRVALPVMPDLGYEPNLGSGESAADTTGEPQLTVVQSQLLRMIEEPGQTLFRFSDAVEISATNLDVSCERLDVIASESAVAQGAKEPAARLEVERIEAHDRVEIRQAGRTASAKRAFFLPKEGKVVLEDEAVVTDARGQVFGYRMTLLQGQRRAIVEGGQPGQERARITLPGFSED
ncbi:MAG: LptA/OstA family protein [Opitutales bacterium]